MTAANFIRISYEEIKPTLKEILLAHGLDERDAETCASVFAGNSRDGVYSHGVNRFSSFIRQVQKGKIKPQAHAICVHASGALEQWHGQSGPGPVNAIRCTDRAMEIASGNGLGCVALSFSNHWMRGGTYGWQAARKGFAFIGWSNTYANLPAWGAVNAKLGNNPLVIALPFEQDAIVLDMAMSQYSYGALEIAQQKNEMLPLPGGYDKDGNLSRDPEKILQSKRALPIGYWKGSGLSLLLDVLGAVLSNGLSVSKITEQKSESNLTQVFIAFDLNKLGNSNSIQPLVRQIVEDYKRSVPQRPETRFPYPGEKVLTIRAENDKLGIPVAKKTWEDILAFQR